MDEPDQNHKSDNDFNHELRDLSFYNFMEMELTITAAIRMRPAWIPFDGNKANQNKRNQRTRKKEREKSEGILFFFFWMQHRIKHVRIIFIL